MTDLLKIILAMPLPLGILLFMWWRSSHRWRMLAESYAADGVHPNVEKWGWLVLRTGPLQYNTYNGITVAGIEGNLLTLRIVRPFGLFHAPLAIPFNDISVEPASWYLNDHSFALRTRRVPGVTIVMPQTFIHWIEQQTGRRLLPRETAVQRAA